MSAAGPLLRCVDLEVGYRGRSLLPPINLSLERGELLLVVGQNGSGKSTWFKTVLGLLQPLAGRVEFASPRPHLSYVPQAASLDPLLPLTARDVALWGRLRGWRFLSPLPSRSDRQKAALAMDAVQATRFQRHAFGDLSGGQQQRALFAQLLASEAELVFLDEPTASMDVRSERDTYERLANLAHTRKLGVVVITHTLDAVAALADRVLFFDRGHGATGEGGHAVLGSLAELRENHDFERQFGSSLARAQSADTEASLG